MRRLQHHMGLDERNHDFVSFPLISWVRCGAGLYRFLIFALFHTLWLVLINKGADQPAHPRSLISAFVIRYLKSKVTGSFLIPHCFGGLQHDKVSGYAPEHE